MWINSDPPQCLSLHVCAECVGIRQCSQAIAKRCLPPWDSHKPLSHFLHLCLPLFPTSLSLPTLFLSTVIGLSIVHMKGEVGQCAMLQGCEWSNCAGLWQRVWVWGWAGLAHQSVRHGNLSPPEEGWSESFTYPPPLSRNDHSSAYWIFSVFVYEGGWVGFISLFQAQGFCLCCIELYKLHRLLLADQCRVCGLYLYFYIGYTSVIVFDVYT
jgi:hypothetical protein